MRKANGNRDQLRIKKEVLSTLICYIKGNQIIQSSENLPFLAKIVSLLRSMTSERKNQGVASLPRIISYRFKRATVDHCCQRNTSQFHVIGCLERETPLQQHKLNIEMTFHRLIRTLKLDQKSL